MLYMILSKLGKPKDGNGVGGAEDKSSKRGRNDYGMCTGKESEDG